MSIITISEAKEKMDKEGIKYLPVDSPREIEMAEIPERVIDVDNQSIAYLVKVYPVRKGKREGELCYMFISEDTLNGMFEQLRESDKMEENRRMYG